jgi:shikimate kinase/3-dehydroquinate synthase
MDVVLVGLPGSGKTATARRLASRHGAALIDTDAEVERDAGMTIPEIFETEGEAAFRGRDRTAVERIGAPTTGAGIERVIATGGGTVMDPRSRWQLYRDRVPIWLDIRPEAAAQRLRRSPFVRPLVQGRDPVGTVRNLAAARARFYGAATAVNAMQEPEVVLEAVEAIVRDRAAGIAAGTPPGTVLLRAATKIGELVIGEGFAGAEAAAILRRLEAGRAIVITEPGAWGAVGPTIRAGLEAAGLPVEVVELPSGEAAKTLATIELGARALARLRVDRAEPLIAVGGGALTDAAGFLAATYLRGVPVIHIPTTLAGQLDAAIGGKTAVDLPEGKNLVGAFHQPVAVIADIALLAGLPERDRRAALGEAVKDAALGEERLFDLLERDGETLAAGDPAATASGALAELVERCAWQKVEVVLGDEREALDRETAGRISLNLGHTLAHGLESATDYRRLLHGEAVAYGLRGAMRIGVARGVTPPERAARVEALLDRLELGSEPLDVDLDRVLAAIRVDKKALAGRIRWVLPTADGFVLDREVPDELVRQVATDIVAGRLHGAAA